MCRRFRGLAPNPWRQLQLRRRQGESGWRQGLGVVFVEGVLQEKILIFAPAAALAAAWLAAVHLARKGAAATSGACIPA